MAVKMKALDTTLTAAEGPHRVNSTRASLVYHSPPRQTSALRRSKMDNQAANHRNSPGPSQRRLPASLVMSSTTSSTSSPGGPPNPPSYWSTPPRRLPERPGRPSTPSKKGTDMLGKVAETDEKGGPGAPPSASPGKPTSWLKTPRRPPRTPKYLFSTPGAEIGEDCRARGRTGRLDESGHAEHTDQKSEGGVLAGHGAGREQIAGWRFAELVGEWGRYPDSAITWHWRIRYLLLIVARRRGQSLQTLKEKITNSLFNHALLRRA